MLSWGPRRTCSGQLMVGLLIFKVSSQYALVSKAALTDDGGVNTIQVCPEKTCTNKPVLCILHMSVLSFLRQSY